MKLSLKLLSLGLVWGNVQIVSTRSSRPDQMRLNSLMLWNWEQAWDHSVCYVMDARELTPDFRCPDNIALILLGHAEPHRFSGANADILIWEPGDQPMSFRDQYNHLSSIFWYYQDLESRILRRLMDSSPLQELITFGETLFRNPLVLLDGGFSLLLKSSRVPLPDWESPDDGHNPALPADTVEQIRLSSEFRTREQNAGVFSLSNEFLSSHARFIQIQREQQVYYLGVLETAQPLTEAHDHLLLYFADFVPYALRSRRFTNTGTMYFDELISRMLQEKIEPSQIRRQLQTLRWKNDHRYTCFVLELDLWNRKDIDAYSICRMVENKFPNTYASLYGDRIICVINLEHAGIRQDEFLLLLAPYVRDQLFRAGVSYEFQDFSAFPSFYQQALAALELGKQKAPDEWSHRFDRYALDYFTRYGTSRMHERHLCHPDLIRLHRYDLENRTNLLATLQTYLACGQNATTTAAELYIHRNTLYQRMTKIESLIQSNLSDPATRLYLQISFSIMDFGSVPSDP